MVKLRHIPCYSSRGAASDYYCTLSCWFPLFSHPRSTLSINMQIGPPKDSVGSKVQGPDFEAHGQRWLPDTRPIPILDASIFCKNLHYVICNGASIPCHPLHCTPVIEVDPF